MDVFLSGTTVFCTHYMHHLQSSNYTCTLACRYTDSIGLCSNWPKFDKENQTTISNYLVIQIGWLLQTGKLMNIDLSWTSQYVRQPMALSRNQDKWSKVDGHWEIDESGHSWVRRYLFLLVYNPFETSYPKFRCCWAPSSKTEGRAYLRLIKGWPKRLRSASSLVHEVCTWSASVYSCWRMSEIWRHCTQ